MNALLLSKFEALENRLLNQQFRQEWFTVAEVAKLTSKRPFTVREWCRLGRIKARKTASGRGDAGKEEWRVHHDEIERYRNEGLLPLRK